MIPSRQILFILIIVFILYFLNASDITLSFLLNSEEFEDKNIDDAIKRKYISTIDLSGRLGNMLFRVASLYGIGRYLDRIPYFHGNNTMKKGNCNSFHESFNSYFETFPVLSEYVDTKIPQDNLIKEVNFTSCCQYVSPEKLKQYKDVKYLHISQTYLQSYKFFNQYELNIKKLLECSQKIKNEAHEYASSLWKNDMSSHKLCIHVRRSDFIEDSCLQETLSEFVSPAAKYIFNEVRKRHSGDISLLMFGDDQDFLKAVNISELQLTSVSILKNFTAEFDMCFAIEYCNTMLLSASASTYGWWIAYLKKRIGDVYYNANVTKSLLNEKTVFASDLFLPEWKKIKLDENNSIVAI